MPRKPFLALCLLLLVALDASGVHAEVSQGPAGGGRSARQNAWSARSSTGRVFAGTWTVAATDPAAGTATGTWTLADAKGNPVARGGWSAAKSATGWSGNWRAAVSGSKTEYSGTWNARVDLKPDAQFADLFAMAVKAVVSGDWRAGGQSGAWSIRVSE